MKIVHQFRNFITSGLSLEKRKGGGGHGSSGHGSSDHGSSGHSSGPSGAPKSSPPKGSSGRGSTGKVPPSSSSFPLGKSPSSSTSKPKSGSLSATSYSEGGGPRVILSSDSPFSGRYAGGGLRDNIYGDWRYGSGYLYGGYGSYVEGRPFPYYFWPACPGYNYYGDEEYCPSPSNANAAARPGGNLSVALIQSPSINETYRVIGDNSSVTAIIAALVANCSMTNTSAVAFIPDNSTNPLPQQMVQYYRSSSFGLSLDSYDNAAASYANMPLSNTSSMMAVGLSTPLPADLNMTFLTCVNETIGAALPLVNAAGNFFRWTPESLVTCCVFTAPPRAHSSRKSSSDPKA